MKEKIIIKGNQHGLTVMVKEPMAFEKVKEVLAQKLNASRKFFGDASVTIHITGQNFSEEEKEALIDVIHSSSDLDVSCLVDENTEYKPQKNQEDIPLTPQKNEDNLSKKTESYKKVYNEDVKTIGLNKRYFESTKEATAVFRYGTLRSGQQLEVPDSVVFIGNIHPGAKIIARGNIIVLGTLRGSVHAGYGGNYKAFVLSLKMNPTQIRIGKYIGRSPDTSIENHQPMMAFVDQENIYIEQVDNKIFKELKLLEF